MFSHSEQEEIINKFLDTIEANDMMNEYKNIFRNSSRKFDNINIAFKQSILPANAIDLIKSFDEETYEDGNRYEELEFEIDELKEETAKQKRRIDTVDMFFLLYNIPDYKEIHKIFQYNVTLSSTLFGIIVAFRRGIKDKKWFYSHCKAYCRDPDITLKTINKIIRYVFNNDKYRKYNYEYNFSKCPVVKI